MIAGVIASKVAWPQWSGAAGGLGFLQMGEWFLATKNGAALSFLINKNMRFSMSNPFPLLSVSNFGKFEVGQFDF